MKTRSEKQYNHHEVVHLDGDDAMVVDKEGTLVVSLTETTNETSSSSIPKALRRVEQNAQAAFRLSVVRDAVKELKKICSKNGGRAIYGDFKTVLKKYKKFKFVTRSAVIYRLNLNESLVPGSIDLSSTNNLTTMSDITNTTNDSNNTADNTSPNVIHELVTDEIVADELVADVVVGDDSQTTTNNSGGRPVGSTKVAKKILHKTLL